MCVTGNDLQQCAICGSVDVVPYLQLQRNVWIFMCRRCTNAFTIPPPEISDQNNSFFMKGYLQEEAWRSYAKSIADFIHSHMEPGCLLDVGTGAGFLLEEAQRLGFKAEGIEVSNNAVEYCRARGLRVRHGTLTTNLYEPESFDVIVISHVIEHLTLPGVLVDTCRALLKQTGYLCISQTNYKGTVPRLLKRRWQAWVPQEHYVHFSDQGIAYLLEAHGFRVRIIRKLPLGYRAEWKSGLAKIPLNSLNTLKLLISKFKIGFPFEGDQMYILAEKSRSV